jgi:hypothetical protein
MSVRLSGSERKGLTVFSPTSLPSQTDSAELADRDRFDVWRSLKPNQRDCASAQLFFTARADLLTACEELVEFSAEKLAEEPNGFAGLG